MRNILLAIVIMLLPAAIAAAEPSGARKPDTTADRLLPIKGTGSGNSCTAYGPGFAKVAGSDTCVKIGGTLSIEAGSSARSR